MSAAAQTSEPANPSTGKDRLLAIVRWLVLLLFVHYLITRGRQILASFHRRMPAGDLARFNRGLRRAVALQAELLALRPSEGDWDDINRRRAICAVVIDICTDLGVFRAAPTRTIAKPAPRRVFHRLRRTSTTRRSQACPTIPLFATGPPVQYASPARSAGEAGDPGLVPGRREGVPHLAIHAGGPPPPAPLVRTLIARVSGP